MRVHKTLQIMNIDRLLHLVPTGLERTYRRDITKQKNIIYTLILQQRNCRQEFILKGLLS